ATLGARFLCFDLGDYPLEVDRDAMERLAQLIRDIRPDAIITHTPLDPFNPDHPVAHDTVQRARLLSAGAGVASAFETIEPPPLYYFEPHQPELCGFVPNVFVDITPVYEQKLAAMQVMASQQYLQRYYAELAERRANHARRISGAKDIRYAEAFQRVTPIVTRELLAHG
ncbi:MAG: PIG-L family deacetylase, partial [Thermomicrobium sp.]|nr:PIG-L family deacetylase [Thermomicrobium sp.]